MKPCWNALSSLLVSVGLVACTVVSAPRVSPETRLEPVYVLNSRGWLSWIGIVAHAAIALRGPDGEWVQYGFGDLRYMQSDGFIQELGPTARLMTWGLFFSSQGGMERIELGELDLCRPRDEREKKVADRADMSAVELWLPTERVSALRETLEANFAPLPDCSKKLLISIESPRYRLLTQNCQSLCAEWLRATGAEVSDVRVLPRWSFWCRGRPR